MKYLILLLLLVPLSAADHVSTTIRHDELLNPGDEALFYVNVFNNKYGLDDVQVRIDSPDLDIFGLSREYDIESHDSVSYFVPVDIPRNAQEGDYWVKVTVYENDDDLQQSYYRIISIR